MIATPYHRVRHACITRSMIVGLSNGARLVLEGLRWALPDEVPTEITQAEIAEAANVSGATVNRVLLELADAGFLIWASVPRADGRGWRWQITLCQPPEVSDRSAADQDRSGGDRAEVIVLGPVRPTGEPTPPDRDRSASDRQPDHVLAHDQQQLLALSDGQLLLYNALRAERATHEKALKIVQICPDRTPAEFTAQIRRAADRGKDSPTGLILWLWERGNTQEYDDAGRYTADHGRDRIRPGNRPAHRQPGRSSGRPRRSGDESARTTGSLGTVPASAPAGDATPGIADWDAIQREAQEAYARHLARRNR